MNGESIAIIAVMLLLAGISLRGRRKDVALLTIPLTSVPVFHLLTTAIYPLLRGMGYDLRSLNIGMIVIGVVAGAAACSLLSHFIQSKRIRSLYLLLSLGFQVAIAIGYIINLL